MSNTEKKNTPLYRAYVVLDAKNEENPDFWLPIGAAWIHGDGEGFNIQLNALPVDGKITLRKPKAKPEGEAK